MSRIIRYIKLNRRKTIPTSGQLFKGFGVVFVVLSLTLSAFIRIAEADELNNSKRNTNSSVISLEKLLQIPQGYSYGLERKAGASAGEWRTRFRGYRARLEQERQSLEKDEEELSKVAGAKSSWQWAAPGIGTMSGGGEDQTKHYQLRQKIRDRRIKIEELEWKARELEVEANLAGVPNDWRD